MLTIRKYSIVVFLLAIVVGAVTTWNIQPTRSNKPEPSNPSLEKQNPDDIELQKAIAHALNIQSQPEFSDDLEDQIDFLGRLDQEDSLSKSDRDRFYQQMVKPVLSIRETIRQGDPIAIQMTHRYRVPRKGIVCRILEDQFTVDDDELIYHDIWAGESQQGEVEMNGPGQLNTVDLLPGEHNLTYSATIGLYHDDIGESFPYEPVGQPFTTISVTTEGTFTTIAEDAEDPLILVVDADTEKKLREILDFKWYVFKSTNEAKQLSLIFGTNDPLPIGISFDLFIQVDGRDIPAGTVCSGQGKWWTDSTKETFTNPDFDYESAKLFLRLNPDLARKTADIWRIWGKDIIIEADNIEQIQFEIPGQQ